MTEKPKILFVEDDESFGYIFKEYLDFHGFETTWIKDGKAAIKKIQEQSFELCILDMMLPGADGIEIARKLKTIAEATPFIFLTARSLKTDKLKGFQAGCDDYEVKPVDEEVLLAKIRAILNRVSRSSEPLPSKGIHQIGKYVFDVANQSLTLNNEIKKLTEKESALLQLLYTHKNRLVERKYILKQIWGIADLF